MAAPTGAAILMACLMDCHPPMRRRFALVFNPSAGSPFRGFSTACSTGCANARRRFSSSRRVTLPKPRSASRSSAGRGVCDAVVAAGGDGTFRAVATGAAGTGSAGRPHPSRHGKRARREIGLAGRASRRSRMCCSTGDADRARGGLVNGAPFFLMLGAGFDARIVAKLRLPDETRLRPRRLCLSGHQDARRRAPQVFDVELDGRKVRRELGHPLVRDPLRQLCSRWRLRQAGPRYTHGSGHGSGLPARHRHQSLSLAFGWLARPDTRPNGVHVLPG